MNFVIANWKMYVSAKDAVSLAEKFVAKYSNLSDIIVAVCPPILATESVADVFSGSTIALGAQDVSIEAEGAHTGEVSAKDLKQAGCEYVLVGHSERRKELGETDDMINKKLIEVLEFYMTPVLLVGETREQYEDKKTLEVVESQLRGALQGVTLFKNQHLLIGYEPIWAIAPSTYTAEPKEIAPIIQHIHDTVDKLLSSSRYHVLYGGSVNSTNIQSFIEVPGVAGVVPGSASTKIEEFGKMLNALHD